MGRIQGLLVAQKLFRGQTLGNIGLTTANQQKGPLNARLL
jgi:hypothetical protein